MGRSWGNFQISYQMSEYLGHLIFSFLIDLQKSFFKYYCIKLEHKTGEVKDYFLSVLYMK